jgi:phage gpG-like protein
MTLTVTGLDRVIVRLQEMPDAVRRSIARVVTEEAIRLETVVKDEKLSGQVLKNRTGRLRSSIHHQVDIGAATVTASIYTNVAYAHFWEYGFSGTESVRQHLRHIITAFGRPLETPKDVLVRAHSRRVDQPARSFLRSTLAENRAIVTARIQAAAWAAVIGEPGATP